MYGKISYTTPDPRRVQAADPLNADEACAAMPQMNSEADVVSLTKALEKIVPAEADLSRFDEVECLASMRDIGMFLSSIRRHGQQPLDVLPSAEPVLRELGVRTNMVPRETLNHYVVWNPEGSRERLYTGDPMESILMKSIRTTLPRLGTSIEICRQLHEVDIRDARAAELLGELAENLGPFASSMAVVLRDVTPIFFAQSMRPFFDDVTVGDRDYRGLAAAHMPLALVDLALWSSDHPDTQYEQFWRPSVEYVVPHLRDDFDDWKQRPSLVSRAAAAVEDDSAPRNALGDALAALAESLGTLASFRRQHLRIAGQAYAEKIRLYPRGNLGNDIEELRNILDLTAENAALAAGKKPEPA